MQEEMLRLAVTFTNLSKMPYENVVFLFHCGKGYKGERPSSSDAFEACAPGFHGLVCIAITGLNCIKCLIPGSSVLQTCVSWRFLL